MKLVPVFKNQLTHFRELKTFRGAPQKFLFESDPSLRQLRFQCE